MRLRIGRENNQRGLLCGLIADALPRESGYFLISCPINTSKGVKVADIAWASPEFILGNIDRLSCSIAPALCIDVIIAGIATDYYGEKRELYFARGAQEVWLCDEQGGLTFYDCAGEIPASRLFPGITRIESEYLH